MGKIREKIAGYLRGRRVKQYNNDGVGRMEQKRYKDAIEYFDEALRIDWKNAIVLENKGDALFLLKRDKEANKCYDKALEFNPRCPDILEKKALVSVSMNDFHTAKKYFDLSLEFDPEQQKALREGGKLRVLPRLHMKI